MSLRSLPPESSFVGTPYHGGGFAQRRRVLRETVAAFELNRIHYRDACQQNVECWFAQVKAKATAKGSDDHPCQLLVLPGDWGAVTGRLTREYGCCFAVLNMANAHVPGGAYLEGTAAQEENMFRRTDCHFHVQAKNLDSSGRFYCAEMTARLTAAGGRVYLDTETPRLCIRGPEDRNRDDLGYRWLADNEIFPFYELRAAAQDLRDGSSFDEIEAAKRIAAQLETLRDHSIRHVILSAFGCGAFRNPAHRVAAIYRDEIAQRLADFRVIAFAIFAPGYGPDNFTPFKQALAELTG